MLRIFEKEKNRENFRINQKRNLFLCDLRKSNLVIDFDSFVI